MQALVLVTRSHLRNFTPRPAKHLGHLCACVGVSRPLLYVTGGVGPGLSLRPTLQSFRRFPVAAPVGVLVPSCACLVYVSVGPSSGPGLGVVRPGLYNTAARCVFAQVSAICGLAQNWLTLKVLPLDSWLRIALLCVCLHTVLCTVAFSVCLSLSLSLSLSFSLHFPHPTLNHYLTQASISLVGLSLPPSTTTPSPQKKICWCMF